ncbi:MAG: PAS domain S-box protein [candidate division WOR-3 bacterium]|nr:PAS domain S-box protein [candidate division WOR-3 bacterium]
MTKRDESVIKVGERYRVLLVEDDTVDQLAFKRAVKEQGSPYAYDVAGSVAEARDLLSRNRYDAVITDYSLGDGTAFDVIELARGIPLVFTTGAGDEEVAVRAMKSGAADYLVKDHERTYLKKLPVTVENAIRRHKAEEQVRKLTRAVEQSPATVVITDTAGHIEYVNPKFTQLTGYSAEEVIGKNPRVLKSGEQSREFYEKLWTTILAGGEWHGEFHNRKKNGELFWEFSSISPVRDRDGEITHFVAVKEDVTERKQLEEERERLISELDAFAHTVAHDLKNPLSAVLGFAELLTAEGVKLNSRDVDESLQSIYQSAKKMHSIIEELLLLAGVRKTEVEARQVDMASVVSGALQRLSYMTQEYGPEVILPGQWPVALGYGPWIEEVWANYLSNAMKYGGKPPRLELGADTLDGKVRFRVRDNGPGLTPEQQAQLFTPFTRLHQVRATGQGLGLSIVRRIMEKLGGEAWVESEPGKGSTFGFTLPDAGV